jgi:phosphohistidine swiveling domain-containing protein
MTELVRFQAGPFGSPTSIFSTFLTSVVAQNVWVPFDLVKQATVEIIGGGTFNVQLFGTNQDNPVNQDTLTVGGTLTTGNVITSRSPPAGKRPSPSPTRSSRPTRRRRSSPPALPRPSMPTPAPRRPASSPPPLPRLWPSVGPGAGVPEFQQPSSPPQANNAEVANVRAEAAAHRVNERSANEQVTAANARIAELTQEVTRREEAARAAGATEVTTWKGKAMEAALKAAALAAGLVDVDLVPLIKKDGIVVAADGTITGIPEAIAAFKTATPSYFGTRSADPPPAPSGPRAPGSPGAPPPTNVREEGL